MRHPIKTKAIGLIVLCLYLGACDLNNNLSELTRVVETAVPAIATLTPTASALARVTAAPARVVPTETATATATTAVLPTFTPSPTPIPAPFTLGPAQILGRGQIMDADFTADGHALAVAWAAGVSLVNTADAQEIWWQPLPVPPSALDMQTGGEAIALAMSDGSVLMMQTADRSQQAYAISNRSGSASDIAWSPDASEIAVQFQGELIKRLDMATGQIAEVPFSRQAGTHPYLVWSPDGGLISLADWGKDCTQLLAIDSGETRFTLQQDNTCYASHAIAWSPDGRLLALGNPAGTIDLVELSTNSVVQSMPGVLSSYLPILQLGSPLLFSSDGTLLASIGGLEFGANLPITVWSMDTSEVIGETNSALVNRVASAFADDGLVSLYEDGRLTHWDFDKQAEELDIGRLPVAVTGWPPFDWSENGRYLATGNRQDGLIVWDVATGQPRLSLEREMAGVAFSPDEQLLAAIDRRQGELQLYDLATGQVSRVLPGATAVMQGVAFSPDGRYVAYGAGNTVLVVEVATGVETAVLSGYPPDQTITQIRWAPDGTAFMAGSDEYDRQYEGEEDVPGVTILWEQTAVNTWTEAFRAEHIYNDSYPDAMSAVFNPGGSLVAFESLRNPNTDPYQIFVYDRQQKAVILTMENYRLTAWQSDTLLLTFSSLGDILLTQWHVHTGEKVVGMARAAGTMTHAPDRLFFVQPTSNGRGIEIREWRSDQVMARGVSGHKLGLMIWSPDGRFLAAAANDGTIVIWSVQWQQN